MSRPLLVYYNTIYDLQSSCFVNRYSQRFLKIWIAEVLNVYLFFGRCPLYTKRELHIRLFCLEYICIVDVCMLITYIKKQTKIKTFAIAGRRSNCSDLITLGFDFTAATIQNVVEFFAKRVNNIRYACTLYIISIITANNIDRVFVLFFYDLCNFIIIIPKSIYFFVESRRRITLHILYIREYFEK